MCNINYVSKFTVSYFLILRGSLVVEVDSKIYTQQWVVFSFVYFTLDAFYKVNFI